MNDTKTDIGAMTAVELTRLFAQGSLSPVEAAQAALERIARFNPAVNAYCHVDEGGAMTAARAAEARWRAKRPLSAIDGVPSSIKDLTLAAGMPTRKGSRTINSPSAGVVDAPFSQRMREAGAVLLGKTTTPEFGWKGVTDSPLAGITRNPWDVTRTAGGSSGGAAAAAALNMGVLHQGSDAGGSIRIPCGFCGVFGMKPTFGWVPQWPASAMTTLSHLGPVSRTVADSALMLNVVARPDDRDWYQGAGFPADWMDGLDAPLAGVRIAYSRTLGYISVRPDILARTDEAVAALAALGASVEETDPGFDDPIEGFNALWFAGAAKLVDSIPADKRGLMDPGLLAIAEAGRTQSILNYMRATNLRAALGETMAAFHRGYDLLVTPGLPITAFEAGRNAPDGDPNGNWVQWTPFTYPFNMTQQPTAAVPCGFADDGLPVSLQIVAAKYQDQRVMQAAFALERALPPVFPEKPVVGKAG